MRRLFVDTSGWASLADADQQFHSLAKSHYAVFRQDNARFVTTNYVIAELIALLTSPIRMSRARVIEYVQSIKMSTNVVIAHVDKEMDSRSFEFLQKRGDKAWSLVDCSSFLLMQEEGIADALTTDHHFEQAGFVRLLK